MADGTIRATTAAAKAPIAPNERVEREVVDLEGQQHDPEDQPHEDHTAPLFNSDVTATRSNHPHMIHGPRL